MIKEDYVSFETAKLLKEKGFDVETEHKMWYVVKQFSTGCHWNSCTYKVGDITREYNKDCCIPIPTLQMAMKWFLKKYNIFIGILFLEESDGFGYTIENIITKKYIATSKNSSYKEPEEACEAALKYCLENLI